MDGRPEIAQSGGDKGNFPGFGYFTERHNPNIQASFIPAESFRDFIRIPYRPEDTRCRIVVSYESSALRQIRFPLMCG